MNLAFLKTGFSKYAMLAVLALAAAASVVTGREKPSPAAPERVNRIEAPRVEVAEDIDLSRLERHALAQAPRSDPFAPRSFARPAAQTAGAEPSKPVAPPLSKARSGRSRLPPPPMA